MKCKWPTVLHVWAKWISFTSGNVQILLVGIWFPDVNSFLQYKASVKFKNSSSLPWGQDSIVNIVSRPQAGDQEIFQFPATARGVSLLHNIHTSFWGPQPPKYDEYHMQSGWGMKLTIKTPSSAKKNEGSYIFALPYAFLACRRTNLCLYSLKFIKVKASKHIWVACNEIWYHRHSNLHPNSTPLTLHSSDWQTGTFVLDHTFVSTFMGLPVLHEPFVQSYSTISVVTFP